MDPSHTITLANTLRQIGEDQWKALLLWVGQMRSEVNDSAISLHNEKGAVLSAVERDWYAGGEWHLRDLLQDLEALRSGAYQTWPEISKHLIELKEEEEEAD